MNWSQSDENGRRAKCAFWARLWWVRTQHKFQNSEFWNSIGKRNRNTHRISTKVACFSCLKNVCHRSTFFIAFTSSIHMTRTILVSLHFSCAKTSIINLRSAINNQPWILDLRPNKKCAVIRNWNYENRPPNVVCLLCAYSHLFNWECGLNVAIEF